MCLTVLDINEALKEPFVGQLALFFVVLMGFVDKKLK